jgi:hypothetical protein
MYKFLGGPNMIARDHGKNKFEDLKGTANKK